MRNPTKEEIESIDAYINNISETMIPLSELQEIRQEIEGFIDNALIVYGRQLGSDKLYAYKECLDIIDTHISAWRGKEQE